MRNKAIFFIFFLVYQVVSAADIDTVHSRFTGDDYIITTRLPPGFSPKKNYHIVYMTDGLIGMGDYVLGKSESWKANIPDNCIIIAIGHTGDWHDKRSRDFIPSDISKNEEEDFGMADKFYLFLQKELIPAIDFKFPNKKDRVFIGHSFGGLFCLYTLFRDDKLFDRHFAISPSIWANYYELNKIEEAYHKKHKELKANVVMYVGTLEFLNKVLYSTRNFFTTLKERKYNQLQVSKIEITGANHFGIRKPAVDKIFDILKNQ